MRSLYLRGRELVKKDGNDLGTGDKAPSMAGGHLGEPELRRGAKRRRILAWHSWGCPHSGMRDWISKMLHQSFWDEPPMLGQVLGRWVEPQPSELLQTVHNAVCVRAKPSVLTISKKLLFLFSNYLQ